jgi:hypothetical protein
VAKEQLWQICHTVIFMQLWLVCHAVAFLQLWPRCHSVAALPRCDIFASPFESGALPCERPHFAIDGRDIFRFADRGIAFHAKQGEVPGDVALRRANLMQARRKRVRRLIAKGKEAVAMLANHRPALAARDGVDREREAHMVKARVNLATLAVATDSGEGIARDGASGMGGFH